jgi:hypothetical protein
MLKITWKLDEPDPLDPAGELYLSSESAGFIFEEYTYLDSWLDALTEGFLAARDGITANIDILEEPDPLRFEPLGSRVFRIAYKDQKIEIRDPDRAIFILRRSVKDFLSEFGGDGEILKNRLLIKLKDFSEKEFRSAYEPEKSSHMNSGRWAA